MKTTDQILELIKVAKASEYASEEQVNAENEVCVYLEQILSLVAFERFEEWALKATVDELMDHAQLLIRIHIFSGRIQK